MNITRQNVSTILLFGFLVCAAASVAEDRGNVGHYKDKFVWTGTGQAFVPNFVMFGDNSFADLSKVTKQSLNKFLDEMFDQHGFNGIHVPVFGQWFHIGDPTVKSSDSKPDPRTFDVLEMIIDTVYERGGVTHIWAWGDHDRKQTPRSTSGGIMGVQERAVMDMITSRLGPLKGWTMGYGFDLWEWTNEDQLKAWYQYMKSKLKFNHLLCARSRPESLRQIYDGMDISSFEHHKPDYNKYVSMITYRPMKPSFAEDRFRVRGRAKDYSPDQTRKGLWDATMAGGVAGIWGYLGCESCPSGPYPNKDQLLTYSMFWKNRFLKDMVRDNALTDGYALRSGDSHYVFYKEGSTSLKYNFSGESKEVVAVDAKLPYKEIRLGVRNTGTHVYAAPYASDWAVAVGDFGDRARRPDQPGGLQLNKIGTP